VLEPLPRPDESRVSTDAGRVDDDLFLVEAQQINAGDDATANRIDRLGDGVAVDVLGEVVEGPAGEHRKGQAAFHRDARRARHGAVAAADGKHLGAPGRLPQRRLDVIALAELDDLRGRQCVANFFDDARPGAAARCRIDHQHHACTVGPRWRVHPQRVGGGNLRRNDRGDYSASEHRDARADAEAGEYVARVVRADDHAGQADQTGEQCETKPDGRAFQPYPDGESRGACGVSGRQRVRRREVPALSGQRHQAPAGSRSLPDTFRELVGDQAGQRQADDSAHGASCGRLVSRRDQCCGNDKPQFGVIGSPAQPGHRGVKQWARRFGYRLENLAIQGAQPLSDLRQAD
jgi:hypothetical protein